VLQDGLEAIALTPVLVNRPRDPNPPRSQARRAPAGSSMPPAEPDHALLGERGRAEPGSGVGGLGEWVKGAGLPPVGATNTSRRECCAGCMPGWPAGSGGCPYPGRARPVCHQVPLCRLRPTECRIERNGPARVRLDRAIRSGTFSTGSGVQFTLGGFHVLWTPLRGPFQLSLTVLVCYRLPRFHN